MARDILELVFKAGGGVELRAPTDTEKVDTVVWASDSDQDFTDLFGSEIMSGEEDAEEVLDYLEDKNIIDEDEAEIIDIFDESYDSTLEDEDDDTEG